MSNLNILKTCKLPIVLLLLLPGIVLSTIVMAQQEKEGSVKYTNTHKIVVFKTDEAAMSAAGDLKSIHVIDYPDRKVLIVEDTETRALSSDRMEKMKVQDDFNKILLRDRVIDTTQPIPSVPEALKSAPTPGKQLYLIQFAGPIKEEWLKEVKSQDQVHFVTYVPNHAYLIWTDGPTYQRLQTLVSSKPFLQWTGVYHAAYRIHPGFSSMTLAAPDEDIKVTVQFIAHEGVESSVDVVKQKAKKILRDAWSVGTYKNLVIVISPNALNSIAVMPDVVNVEPWFDRKLFGERQGQILANQLDVAGSQPTGPGYLAWLNALGFNATFNFSVNVSDSGLDRGQTAAASLHPDFLDASGNSRVTFVQEVQGTNIDNSAARNIDTVGHGTIDHAIVGGFNNTPDNPGSGTDFEDDAGFQYGLGIAPFALLGSSRIFNPNFTQPDHTELTNAAYVNGARISSNSWGSTIGSGNYDATSQEFDALVRDARPSSASDGGQAGNQEMVIVWAAGNNGSGASTLGDTGSTSKNTFVVGAGENFNQAGTDGCGVANNGADDAHDVIGFSSRGPTTDNRFKPDIMAPGTHIYGATSQDPGYNGSGVCNQFRPPGQTLYAWSSGTSHATPAVAGATALLRQWFINQGSPAPSPAMTKAYLMNTATWMTGSGGNDTLPSNNQGMGRLNLERTFDALPRLLTDQTRTFDNTGEIHTVSGAIADNTEPFRVTLAWTDAPGATIGNAWVNNLDLEVTLDSGGGPVLYRGNNFNNNQSQPGGAADGVNNVESVWLPPGTTGNFTVTVRAGNIAGDGVPNSGDGTDQDFALVVYNAQTGGGPGPAPVLAIAVVLDPDERLSQGQTTTMRATVTSNGTPQPNKMVNFSTGDTSLATVSPASDVTDASGQAQATVRGETTSNDSTTVTAETNGTSTSVPVRVPDLSLIGIIGLAACLMIGGLWRRRRMSERR